MQQTRIAEEIAAFRQTEHDIHPQFLNRWSPRAFLPKEVDETVLFTVFEAARWAPSANNEQPWRYIFARTPDDRAKFHAFINPSNREWCEEAPALAVVISKKTSASGNPFRTHAFDAGASWAFLALQAAHQGLIAHAMGGFNQEQARAILQVPEDYEIHAVLAIGYPGPAESLSERNREREQPNGRKPLAEMLFEGGFDPQQA